MPSVVAHPLIGSPPLPVPPLVLVAGTALVVAAVVTFRRTPAGPVPDDAPPPAGRVAATTRALVAAGLLALVAVARFGSLNEPENLAAITVPYLLWPGVVLGAVILGRRWWPAVDPWRALGSVERLAGAPPAPPAAPPAVWPAVVAAVAWTTLLVEWGVSTDPRELGIALAAYTVVIVAGCVAVGRDRWLPAAEFVGLLATWTGWRRALASWAPPRGAAALLGALAGGLVAARLRPTGIWGDIALSRHPDAYSRLLALGAALAGAVVVLLLARWAARRDAAGSVEAALVPLVAGLAVAAVLRRMMVAAQLAPSLLGAGQRFVDVNPWGTAVQQALAWLVVTVAAACGALVLTRRASGVRQRDPGAVALYVIAAVAVLAVTAR